METPGPLSIQPGDIVSVRIWREPDLSGQFAADAQGRVVLPLLGPYELMGLETEAAASQLESDYLEYLQNPSIEVTILRRIVILGEVRSPGLYPVDPTVSLSEAIALAGGMSPDADPNKIRQIRGSKLVRDNLSQTSVLAAAEIQSGDQIVVGQKGWVARNAGIVLGSLIAAAAVITAATIANGG